MDINCQTLNMLFHKYCPIIDDISNSYHYPDNIKHLLYLILPAFIIKYGPQKENFILECFRKIPITITGKEDPRVQGLFVRYPKKVEQSYITVKEILLNRYDQIPLMQLIDLLVHEFNHAINSYKNEVTWDQEFLYLRTGLAISTYQKDDLSVMKKDDSYILEEMINTRQTETMIDLTLHFSDFTMDDVEINNTLYAIKHSVTDHYSSSAYLWHTYYSKELLDNKTFFYTLEKLRLEGEIKEIESWFNNIVGKKNAYRHLIQLLTKITILEHAESQKKGFQWLRKKRIKDTVIELRNLIQLFNQNCTYK